MTGIWDFPNISDLRDFFEETIPLAKQELQAEVEEDRAVFLDNVTLDDIVVVDEWGRGTAEIGQDELQLFVFFDLDAGEQAHLVPQFDPATKGIIDVFVSLINEGRLEPPEPATEWFPRVDPLPQAESRWETQISLALGSGVDNTVFNLSRMEAIQYKEPPKGQKGLNVDEMPRIALEELQEPEDEAAEEEEPDIEPEDTEGEEPFRPSEEEVALQAPTTFRDAQLIPWEDKYGIVDGHIQVPAGDPTKKVEVRDLYDFEFKMALPAPTLGNLEGYAQRDRMTNGIGFAMEINKFGTSEPPSTYPRTSSYVRNRLLFEGPAYILQLYNELVVYSGFISSFYDMELRPGSYQSFREFMYRLHEIGERGGPTIVNRMSQQQAAARGLDTIPDHPSIEGEKAPWLENRQYYSIVEDNKDHDVWDNPTEYLYEELEQE